MRSPRPRDFLRAELVRLSTRRDAVLRQIDDEALRRPIRRMYDQRIEDLVDQLSDAMRPPDAAFQE